MIRTVVAAATWFRRRVERDFSTEATEGNEVFSDED